MIAKMASSHKQDKNSAEIEYKLLPRLEAGQTLINSFGETCV